MKVLSVEGRGERGRTTCKPLKRLETVHGSAPIPLKQGVNGRREFTSYEVPVTRGAGSSGSVLLLKSGRAQPHSKTLLRSGECQKYRPGLGVRLCSAAFARSCETSLAFSLIEILVTISLLAFIILGLLAMFTQTQKAFRGSMKQTDVLGSGRAVMDMLSRELAQMTPSQMARTLNFFAEIPPALNPPNSPPFAEVGTVGGNTYPALSQALPGSTSLRTNVLQRFFFLTLVNQDWVGTGYQVLSDYPGAAANTGVGTLYRFTSSKRNADATLLASNFVNTASSNLSRIADGVVHLRVRAFATNGFPIMGGNTNACWFRTNYFDTRTFPMKNTQAKWDQSVPEEVDSFFYSNAVPAYVELELGILEPNIFERFKSIPATAAASKYLSDHAAQVHLFRQRIPVRNVDFNAYQ